MNRMAKPRELRGKADSDINGKTTVGASEYREILRLLSRYPAHLLGFMLFSLLSSVTEGMGLGAALSLLKDPEMDLGLLDNVPLLDRFSQVAGAMALPDRVRVAAIALIVIYLVRGILAYGSQMLSFLLQVLVDRELRRQVFGQLLQVELGFIHRERIGNLFTLLNAYPHRTSSLIDTVMGGITHLFTIAIYTAGLFLVSWQLTLIALGLLLGVTTLLRVRFAARFKQAGRDMKRAMKRLNSIGIESLSGIKLIHLFSREQQSMARFEDALQEYQDYVVQRAKLISLMRPLFNTMNVLVLGLLLIAGTFFLPSETSSWIARMGVFLLIVSRLMAPAAALNTMRAQITSLYPVVQELLEFLRREDKPYLKNGRIRFQALKAGIALHRVTFRYDPSEPPVIENVTMEIGRGRMTAVVGPSGAGKTTLVNLIARLYDCEEGRITVDGVDLRDLDIASWHARIGVVSQDTFIFNDTVSANLRFAREDAREEEIRRAAELANAHDFIMSLPQGYETVLGDRGVRLSGGQQQRVSIARAILSDPQVLILDEATSHLDSETERLIQEAIDRVSQNRTTLVVAHRLSTIRHADNIVVFKEARVVEQGSHEELMRQRGHYWGLVEAQRLEEPQAVGNGVQE